MNSKRGNESDSDSKVTKDKEKEDSDIDADYSDHIEEISIEENEDANNGNSPLYSCFHCNWKFSNYRMLDLHIRLTPVEELEKSLELNTAKVLQNCNQVIEDSPPNVKETISVSDIMKFPKRCRRPRARLKCPMCDYTSLMGARIKNHILAVHTNIKGYNCPFCGFISGSSEGLKQHIEIHTHRPFHCRLCDYKGIRELHLKRHMENYHNGEKAFKCQICEAKLTTTYKLSQHIREFHADIVGN